MTVMDTIATAPTLREADNYHYLTWCRDNAFLFCGGHPSARRCAMEMNTEYSRATHHAVPDQWTVK